MVAAGAPSKSKLEYERRVFYYSQLQQVKIVAKEVKLSVFDPFCVL